MTREDLKGIIYDPYKLMDGVLESIEDSGSELVDPTNPFLQSLEIGVLNTSNALVEMVGTYRKLYSSLSSNTTELYPHMTDDMELNMFASPADMRMQFNLSFNDIFSHGISVPNKPDTYTVTIPEKTMITIGDLDFTLLNKIQVTINKSSSFVEELPGDFILVDKNTDFRPKGVIESFITTDGEGNKWVSFIIVIRQLTLTSYSTNLLSDEEFKKVIPIQDQYYVLNARLNINGTDVILKKTHGSEILDLDTPTMMIKNNIEDLEVTIPNINHYGVLLNGELNIDIYTTRGKILLPLNNKLPDEFIVRFPKVTTEVSSSIIKNINMVVNTDDVLDGGVNVRGFKDIRKKIIYNTSGDVNLPITDYQLTELARLKGFKITKVLDTITDRLYFASKNLLDFDYETESPININVFSGTCEFVLEDYLDSPNIETTNKIVTIKSSTMLKHVNGKLTVMTVPEVNEYNSLSVPDRINYFNNNDVYFSPYYYIVDTSKDILNTRIFDFDKPIITARNIVSKNIVTGVSVNIKNYEITKIDTGYKLRLTLVGNESFDELANDIKIRISIPNYNGTNIYLDATYDINSKVYTCIIDTKLTISDDNRITVVNGTSVMNTKTSSLDFDFSIYIYKVIGNVNNDEYIHSTDIGLQNDIVTYTYETLTTSFGKELNYLWSKVTGGYTGRKFLKYTEDKLLRYKNIVYELDGTGCPLFTHDTVAGECDDYSPIVLHNVGDVIQDDQGNDLYEYRTGDNVIVNNQLVVDTVGGTIRYLDMLLFEYKLITIPDISLGVHFDMIKLRIDKWLTTDLLDLNNSTLEQTVIKYKPSTYLDKTVTINEERIDNKVTPTITLYLNRDRLSTLPSKNILTTDIGKIIHRYLGKQTIVLEDIRKAIIDLLGNNIEGVKIKGITEDDRELINIAPTASRMYMSTNISLSNTISYNLDLVIETID